MDESDSVMLLNLTGGIGCGLVMRLHTSGMKSSGGVAVLHLIAQLFYFFAFLGHSNA